MGASATNFEEIIELSTQVVGLKMYLNETFTTLKLDGIQQWLKVSLVNDNIFLLRKRRKQLSLFFIFFLQHFEHWPKGVPICVHAEGRTTAAVILLASLNNRSVHVCHVATRDEIEIIKAAKKKVEY